MKIFNKYIFNFKKNSIYILFLILLASNFSHLIIGLEPNGLSLNKPYKIDGDTKDYINSSENLLLGKGFTFYKISNDSEFISNISSKKENEREIFYAFRSPGFAFFYVPFRLFLSQEHSLIGFIIFQTLINALAKLIISIIVYNYTKNKILFILSVIILVTIPYFSQYNNLILTDSLGLSFLTFAFYFFIKSINNDFIFKTLILSGFLFTIAVFLRPFLIIPFAFAALFLIYLLVSKTNLKKIVLALLCFGSTFLIIDSIWVIRNYNCTEKFIPLASTMHFQDHKHSSFKEIKKISCALGYSNNWWDIESPVYWFYKKSDTRSLSEVFSEGSISIEQQNQLLTSRNYMFNSLNKKINNKERILLEKKSEKLLEVINLELKEHHFFQTQIKSRFSILAKFITQPIKRDFHSVRYPFNIILVFYNHMAVNSIIWIGFFACILFLFIQQKIIVKYLSLCTLSIIILFTFVFLSYEYREIYTVLGFLLISSFILVNNFRKNHILIKTSIIAILILALVQSFYQTTQEINW
jgi:4-amino-4-deoxy-L-arabinose transferase-like glycosyltransferase